MLCVDDNKAILAIKLCQVSNV